MGATLSAEDIRKLVIRERAYPPGRSAECLNLPVP